MKINIGVCPLCNRKGILVKSNNPLVASLCSDCLNKELNRKNLKQANLFCRTYNIPFDPSKWIEIEKECGKDVFKNYVELVAEENPNSLYNSEKTDMLWERADREWQKDMTNEQLIERIKPIKAGFIQRMQIQWGSQYTFQEYLKLENLYTNTVRSNGITNPLTLDNVKKIAVVSVAMDKALKEGEVAMAAEYNKMHTTLVKSAGLDDLVTVGDANVISNVSELCQFIEESGGVFKFYDGVSRDIVDATIKDQNEFLRKLVIDNTGIEATYDVIEKQYLKNMQDKTLQAASLAKPIEDLDAAFEKAKSGVNEQFDKEISEEGIDLGDDDDEEFNDPTY